MINGDDFQRMRVRCFNRDSRFVKGGVDGIDGDGVVGVGGITGDVTNDRQGAFAVQQFAGDERRNLLGEVNAVNKDI